MSTSFLQSKLNKTVDLLTPNKKKRPNKYTMSRRWEEKVEESHNK